MLPSIDPQVSKILIIAKSNDILNHWRILYIKQIPENNSSSSQNTSSGSWESTFLSFSWPFCHQCRLILKHTHKHLQIIVMGESIHVFNWNLPSLPVNHKMPTHNAHSVSEVSCSFLAGCSRQNSWGINTLKHPFTRNLKSFYTF